MDQAKTLTTTSSDYSHSTTTTEQHSFTTTAAAESTSKPTKIPSSRFKGVVPQPNGRWGAQIYEKHQRIWLGTFTHEHEAARAYDVAARRFRGRDAVVNFKAATAEINKYDDGGGVEEAFLSSHSKMEIVDMLRKHTYDEELEQSRRLIMSRKRDDVFNMMGCFEFSISSTMTTTTKIKEVLFEKVVTPSDVGKLNRLVIPKQHAEKHFPIKSNDDANNNNNNNKNGSLLNFEDVNGGKAWRFRYSYWNSSQSYVLTKGWSRFVKEKKLKAGDVVIFLRSSGNNKSGGGGHYEKQLYIDCDKRVGIISDDDDDDDDDDANCNNDLKNGLKYEVKTVIRLFGVDVCVGNCVCGEKKKKRCRETEVLGLDDYYYVKKQRNLTVA